MLDCSPDYRHAWNWLKFLLEASTRERSALTLLQEELDLKPGHSFLDVGCGCGIVTACAAYLVSTPSIPSSVS